MRPYRSIAENFALRGGALNFRNKTWHVLLLLSRARRDAAIDSSGFVISQPRQGTHVSATEIRNKDRLSERTSAVLSSWRLYESLTLGASLLHIQYSHKFRPVDGERQHFNFAGNAKQFLSFNATCQLPGGNLRFVAEYARTRSNQHAEIIGLKQNRAGHNFSLLIWNATTGFFADYGMLPGKQIGTTSNVSGYYLGACFSGKAGKYDISIRREKTPWRSYNIPQPIEKQIVTFNFKKHFLKKYDFVAQSKLTIIPKKEEILPNVTRINGIIIENATTGRYFIKTSCRISKSIVYLFRFDFSQYRQRKKRDSYGWVQTHQVRLRLLRKNRIQLRFSLFTIDDYSSRIYHIDYRFPDLLQPVPLSGRGRRVCISYVLKRKYFDLAGYLIQESKSERKTTMRWGIHLYLKNQFVH